MSDSRIGVIYLTDGNRDDLTYASAFALAMHHYRGLDIHVVQAGFRALPPPSVLRLIQARGHRLATHYLPIAERGLQGRGHITATAYAKLEAIEAVAGAYGNVCYLDNDMLTVRPLDLSELAPKSRPLAAAPDLSISTGLDNPAFFRNCDKNGVERRYFNSGLLALNVPRWRDSGIAERYEKTVRKHAEFCPYWDGACQDLDQCALNMASQGDWKLLPVEFNVQKSAFQTQYWEHARIRHYTGADKFLPLRPHRTDSLEYSLLRRIARAIPELGMDIPPRLFTLAYHASTLRRRVARKHISRLIEQHLAA